MNTLIGVCVAVAVGLVVVGLAVVGLVVDVGVDVGVGVGVCDDTGLDPVNKTV